MNLPQAFSTYLDLIRAVCAIAVVFHHYNTRIVGAERVFPDVGQEAVVLFFVLSGFVIAYVARGRERSLAVFTTKRLARIYPVAIAGLALSYLLYGLFGPASPELYARHVSRYPWWSEVAVTLSFLNETYWLPQLTPPTNPVYWSLTCEVWFYVLAGFIFFSDVRWTVVAVLIAMLVLGPKIMLLFPAWLVGAVAQRLCDRRRISRSGALALGMASAAVGAALWASGIRVEWRLPADVARPWGLGLVSDFAYYDALALAASVHLVAAYNFFCHPFRWPSSIRRSIHYAAQSSFSLYVMHFPILFALRAFLPDEPFRYFYPIATVSLLLVFGRPIENLRFPAYRLLSALAGRVRVMAEGPGLREVASPR